MALSCENTSQDTLGFRCDPPSDTHHLALTCGFMNVDLEVMIEPQVRGMGVQLPLGVIRLTNSPRGWRS